MRSGLRALLPLVVALVVAACAETPERAAPQPEPATAQRAPRPAPDSAQARAIAKHQQLAARAQSAGDLASAATEWHVLTLLDPDNEAFRRQLAATRATIARTVDAQLDAGRAAARRGDIDAATQAMLKVLALDSDNAEAAKTLRDIERARASRVQGERAARVARNAMPAPADSFDIEQRIELFRAGDTVSGLRELKRYVDANPGDATGRALIATAVYDRARELETQGARENALAMYEQAVTLRGEPLASWNAKLDTLRKSLSSEYYERGVKAAASDPAQAVRLWETSLKYDPANKAAAAKLAEARRTIAPTKSSGSGS